MSIIAEALKKAQKTPARPAVTPQGKTPPQDRKNVSQPKPKSPIFFVRLFVILVFFLSAITLFILFRNDNQASHAGSPDINAETVNASPVINTGPMSPEPLKPVEEAPATPPITPSIIHRDISDVVKLNGIMYTPKKPLAVINGSIRGVGDYVQEFKILEIGKDFVKVGSAEEEYVLKLQR